MIFSKNIYLLFFLSITILLGCSKKDQALQYLDSPSSFSSVGVFNAIPKSTGVTLTIGQGSSEKTTVTSSDDVKFGKYLNYKNWYSGTFDVFIQNLSSGSREVFKEQVALNPGKVYSLFLFRDIELKMVLTEDNILSPREGRAKIRIAHLCEGLSPVHVKLVGSNSELFQKLTFGSVSNFLDIDIDTFEGLTFNTIDGKIEWNTGEEINLENRAVYTILLKGNFGLNNNDIKNNISVIKQ